MRFVFVLLFLYIHVSVWSQTGWDTEIKKCFREEEYSKAIALCEEDARRYPPGHRTEHDLPRKRIWAKAKECSRLIDSAQKINDINEAKTLLENVIKIREKIWYLVGEGKPIAHPKTKPLIDSIIRKLSNPALISWGGKKKESAKIKEFKQKRDTIGGVGNTYYIINITNNVSKNKKELARVEKRKEQGGLRQDSILVEVKKIEKKQEEIISIFGKQIEEKDSVYRVLEKERENLQREYNVLGDTLALHKKWIAKLDSVIQIQRKGNFLPLGIKQLQNGRKALGYTFLVSEIAVPIALGFGLEHAADQNYKKYKKQQAETLSDHKGYYKKYKNYHRAAIWAPIVTGVLVYGVNVLCNHYCSIKTSDIVLHPTVEVDYRGKVQCGVGMSFNF